MSRRWELTRRQQQVLALIVQEYCNRKIAETLHISEHTVEQHLRCLYKKLGVSNRGEAKAVYIRWYIKN